MKNKKSRKISLLLVPILFLGLFFFGGVAFCQDPIQPEAASSLPGEEEGTEMDQFLDEVEVVEDGVELEKDDASIPTLENSTEQQNEGKDENGTDGTVEQMLQNLTQQKKKVPEKQIVQVQNAREVQEKIATIRLITLMVILLVAVLVVAIVVNKRKKNK